MTVPIPSLSVTLPRWTSTVGVSGHVAVERSSGRLVNSSSGGLPSLVIPLASEVDRLTAIYCWQFMSDLMNTSSSMRRIAFLLGLFVTASANADTIQLDAAHDAMVFQNNANHGAGGAPGFLAGTNSQLSIRRSLISFDVSSIPSTATITNVQLRLKTGSVSGGGAVSHPAIDLHKMLVSWGEANTGASTASTLSGIGQGNPALVGDATWNARFFDTAAPVLWSQPGGQAGVDYAATVSASLVQSDTLGDFSLWLSTEELVDNVQGWLDAPATNHGWMLINQNEATGQTFRGFYSRNFNPIPALPDLASYFPQLIVNFELQRFPGDANGDRVVDFTDLGILLNSYNQAGSFASGDFDSSGAVDFTDLGILLNHYNQIASISVVAVPVPEPSTLALAALGMLGLLIAARRRR